MAFAAYTKPDVAAKKFGIRVTNQDFVGQAPVSVSDYFREELALTLARVPFNRSESGCRETIIYPILREVWKLYRYELSIFSNEPIEYDADLQGTPDFLVTRCSPFGPTIFDQPYLIVIEAKRDDFIGGWGQCLAAMVAVSKMNVPPLDTVYGCTSNGRAWQFGQLTGSELWIENRLFLLTNFDELMAALNWVFVQCREQMQSRPAAA